MFDDLLEPGWRARRVRAGDVTLRLVEAGPADGPLLILLHGFPEFWWAWRHQIGPLAAAGWRVAAPDMRGYGGSDKPRGLDAYRTDRLADDVAALADALGAEGFALVGHDWGGIVAWHVAARHAGRVERLVIMDAPHPEIWAGFMLRHPSQAARSAYVGWFQLPLLPEAAFRAFGFAGLRRTMRTTARAGVFTRGTLDRYAEAWGRPGALTAMLDYYRALRLRGGGPVGRITVPTLVLWGGRDSFLDDGMARESAAMCDDGRAVVIERATHWLHLEEPERVTGELLGHLGEPRL